MKEKTRQSLLSAIGWRKSWKMDAEGPVYVPMAIQISHNLDHHISIGRALAMGATSIAVDEDCYSLQANWPDHYFSAEEAEARRRLS